MIIKLQHFEIRSRRYGKTVHLQFQNFTGKRGLFDQQVGKVTFASREYPAYSEETKTIYLPGNLTSFDKKRVKVPEEIFNYIVDFLAGKIPAPKVVPTLVINTHYIKVLGEFKWRYNTTCKESACYYLKYILDTLTIDKVAQIGIGLPMTEAQKAKLEALIAKLPKEAQVQFDIIPTGVILTLSSWWKDFYRNGWLLVAIRMICQHRTYSVYQEKFFLDKFNLFTSGNHTLTDKAKRLWATQNMNWLHYSGCKNEDAFKCDESN